MTNDLSSTQGWRPAKQAQTFTTQTFIIGLPVGPVKRAEAGNGPVGVEWQPRLRQGSDPLPMSLSQKPHPPGTLVENKGQTPIRKDCQKPVDALFLGFSGRQSGSIAAFFFCFTVRSAEGYKPFQLPHGIRP
jgi:hypothetical protein